MSDVSLFVVYAGFNINDDWGNLPDGWEPIGGGDNNDPQYPLEVQFSGSSTSIDEARAALEQKCSELVADNQLTRFMVVS